MLEPQQLRRKAHARNTSPSGSAVSLAVFRRGTPPITFSSRNPGSGWTRLVVSRLGVAPSHLTVMPNAERDEVVEPVVGRVSVDVMNLELGSAVGESALDAPEPVDLPGPEWWALERLGVSVLAAQGVQPGR